MVARIWSRLAAVLAVTAMFSCGNVVLAQATWTGASSTAWSNAGNWSGGVPAASTTPIFPSITPSTKQAVSVNANTQTLAGLNVQADYTFSGGSQLRLGDGSSASNAGNLTMSTNYTLQGTGSGTVASTLTGSGTTTITSSGALVYGNADAALLTVSGNQTLVFDKGTSVDLTTASNGSIVIRGQIDMGNITINNGGSLSSGTSASYFDGTIDNLNLTGGNTTARIGGTTAGTNYDQFTGFDSATSTAVFGGTLNLNFNPSTPLYTQGTTWNLFDGYKSLAGNFSGINGIGGEYGSTTWSLDNNGNWSSSNLTNGTYLVFNKASGDLVVVPEPSTIVFAGVGVAMAGWSAWKKRRLAKVLAKK